MRQAMHINIIQDRSHRERKKTRVLMLLAVYSCALMVGCRSNTGQELLERELRMQEDKIYKLQDEVAFYQQKLAACETSSGSSSSAPQPYYTPQSKSSSKIKDKSKSNSGPDFEAPAFDAPSFDSDDSAPAFEPPSFDQKPLPGAPSNNVPLNNAPSNKSPKNSDNEAPPFQPPIIRPPSAEIPEGEDDPTEMAFPDANPILEKAVSITLNPRLTGGWDADHQPGDEGVAIVLEPRNAQGEIIQSNGRIGIVVWDLKLAAPAARVARWEFNEQETAAFYRTSFLGKGFHLELPWPEELPKNRELMLYVRFIQNGEEFRVDKAIDVDLLPDGNNLARPPQRDRFSERIPSKESAPSRTANARPSSVLVEYEAPSGEDSSKEQQSTLSERVQRERSEQNLNLPHEQQEQPRNAPQKKTSPKKSDRPVWGPGW